jgi:NAD-dependent deacetylase
MSEAENRMYAAERMVFMGTSFSVNITNIALDIARQHDIPVEVVDPNPVILPYKHVQYHRCTASEYVAQAKN